MNEGAGYQSKLAKLAITDIDLSKTLGENKILGESVVITNESLGISQLLGGMCLGCLPMPMLVIATLCNLVCMMIESQLRVNSKYLLDCGLWQKMGSGRRAVKPGEGQWFSAATTPIHSLTTPIHSLTTPIHSLTAPIQSLTIPIHCLTTPIHSLTTLIHSLTTPIHSFLLMWLCLLHFQPSRIERISKPIPLNFTPTHQKGKRSMGQYTSYGS